MVDDTSTESIGTLVDEYYEAQVLTGTESILKRVVVKQAMKDDTSEWAKNNVWVQEDIAAITAFKISQDRKNKLTDILK
ncbi:hypothetical protein ACSX1A_00560 [Pontibacter sp. MBLB2868]|uniref:hypothetical protein n=1 Tax=Pontibacter sp. MBLB2868 TaxID=3451555 RepID=UPI003F7563D2